MPWIHYTLNSQIDDQNSSFNEAFNSFLQKCFINKELLAKNLTIGQCYRFLIKTDGENDNIVCSGGKIYSKKKFLSNKNFKRCLIDYYNPLGIFVKGPTSIVRRDGVVLNKWLIELTPSYSNYSSLKM